MKLSIIIVNYKSKKNLLRCLGSIFQNIEDQASLEIVIVNNDAGESLEEIRREGKIKIINLSQNIGFGAAANRGAQEAAGELLFFLNPDAEIVSGRIEMIFEELKANQGLGIIGAKIVDAKGAVEPWSAGLEINFLNLILNNLGLSKSKSIWESLARTKADWVSGGAFFIKRKLFLESGGFDENFFLYFEDMDLGKRVRGRGFPVVYFPDFSVAHKGGRSFESKGEQKRHYYDSMEKYFLKHRGKNAARVIRIIKKLLFR